MLDSLEQIVGAYEPRPLPEASTIPAAWYLDARVLQAEQRQVFGRTWQFAGRAEQVAEPGQYITCEVAGEPVLVVRGADRVLRGFYNVCRHHAAAVATETAGCLSILRCPYHGWSYSLEGELKGTPEFDGVCNFERSKNGLVPLRTEVWEKFVFVNLDPKAAPLGEFLGGGLAERVRPLGLERLHFRERRAYELKCNWKVYVDNYLDGGYHVPHLHKGLNSVLDCRHYMIENQDRFCLQSSPMCASDQDPATAATRTGERALYFWQYPNFMLNWYEGVMDTNLVLPAGVERTVVVFDFYFADGPEERKRSSVEVSERIQQEDVAICEAVQRGLGSRAYGSGRLSVRREAGEHLFHGLLFQSLVVSS